MSTTRAGAGSDRLRQIHDQLLAGVADLVDGQAWQRMLTVAARFHAYSPSNVLLIAMQRPEATRVAGYRTWQALGRQVLRGERGIAILAPCPYRTAVETADHSPVLETVDRGGSERALTRQMIGFRVVYVFDLAQTDGEPLPTVEPRLLDGDDTVGLWQALVTQAEDAGFSVSRGDCGAANGVTRYDSREVVVRADVAAAQAVKTLAHELGHIRADHEHRFLDRYATLDCRGQAEVEAESIAYVVCQAEGLDTADYSVDYVAGWAGGDLDVIRGTAARVLSAAGALLDDLHLDTTPVPAEAVAGPARDHDVTVPAMAAAVSRVREVGGP